MAVVFNSDLTQPYSQWEIVDVTFPSTINTDVVVPHSLVLTDPEAVYYVPIRKGQVADVYHDTSGTRVVWQDGYLRLRSSVANAKVTLLLFVLHATPPRTLAF